ncbi:MAG: site-specific integrase [Kineosporiaceae bacterium]|nr:site-specific integrase [Aeromicrobium sp.]
MTSKIPPGTWGKISTIEVPSTRQESDPYARVQAPTAVLEWMQAHPDAMSRIAASLTKRAVGQKIAYRAEARYCDPGTGEVVKVRATGETIGKAETALGAKMTTLVSRFSETAGGLKPNSKAVALVTTYDATVLERNSAGLATSTITSKRRIIKRTVLPALGNLEIRQLTAPKIDSILHDIVDSGRSHEAKEVQIILREMMHLAARYGLISQPPTMVKLAKPKKPGTDENPVKYLSAQQVDVMRRALHQATVVRTGKPGPKPDTQPPQIFDLLVASGARINEALAIRRRDVFIDGLNLAAPFLVIAGTIILKDGKVTRQPHTKSNRDNAVALPAAGVLAIRARLAVIDSLVAEGTRTKATPDDLIFSTRNSTPHQDSNVRRSFSRVTSVLDAITDEGFEFHPDMTRRSGATAIHKAEGGTRASTAGFLNHTNERTLPHYVAGLEGIPTPDFSIVPALDELLPVLS